MLLFCEFKEFQHHNCNLHDITEELNYMFSDSGDYRKGFWWCRLLLFARSKQEAKFRHQTPAGVMVFGQTSPSPSWNQINSTEEEGETDEAGDAGGVDVGCDGLVLSSGELSSSCCWCCCCKGGEGTGEKSKTTESRESRGVREESGGVRSTKIDTGAQASLSSVENCSER